VGLFAIRAAQHQGAGRILVIDPKPERLDMAHELGAETVDFDQEDPVEAVMALTGGRGTDGAIEAVGIEADMPGAEGDAPCQAVNRALTTRAKAGTLAIIGVFPPQDRTFPIGLVRQRNLAVRAGNANHRQHVAELTRRGALAPTTVLSQLEPVTRASAARNFFDHRLTGWVEGEPKTAARAPPAAETGGSAAASGGRPGRGPPRRD
jgi:threonine dehydrogenase-like Zn-dependent dehydrogenase